MATAATAVHLTVPAAAAAARLAFLAEFMAAVILAPIALPASTMFTMFMVAMVLVMIMVAVMLAAPLAARTAGATAFLVARAFDLKTAFARFFMASVAAGTAATRVAFALHAASGFFPTRGVSGTGVAIILRRRHLHFGGRG